MIARIWRGRTNRRDGDAYVEYMNQSCIKEKLQMPGNLGVHVVREDGESESNFTIYSLWESRSAIDRYAGQGENTAVYYPKEENFLLELDPEVEHVNVPEVDRLRVGKESRWLQTT